MFKRINIARIKREISKFWPWIKIILASAAIILVGYILSLLLPPVVTFTKKMLLKPESFTSFAKNPADILKVSSDRTNILLLGIRGEGEGALLTDTMLVFSYHHPSKQLHLISLPRDLWVDSLKAKINTAYFYGEEKQLGGGLDLSKSAASEITGLPMHYAVNLNFEGFKKAIDLVDGIDLTVDTAFDDPKYPIPGKEDVIPESDRYELLHFDAGPQHMDGERALKYVRSRNAPGDEGTDFARSIRQQKVIVAFREKVTQQKILLDQEKVSQLADLYHQYIVTDIKSEDYGAFARLFLLSNSNPVKSISLTTGDKEGELAILENPINRRPYQGQYVLIAKDNNWEALKQYIQNELVR